MRKIVVLLQVFEQAFTVTGKANSMLHTSLEPEEIDRCILAQV